MCTKLWTFRLPPPSRWSGRCGPHGSVGSRRQHRTARSFRWIGWPTGPSAPANTTTAGLNFGGRRHARQPAGVGVGSAARQRARSEGHPGLGHPAHPGTGQSAGAGTQRLHRRRPPGAHPGKGHGKSQVQKEANRTHGRALRSEGVQGTAQLSEARSLISATRCPLASYRGRAALTPAVLVRPTWADAQPTVRCKTGP